MVTDICSFLQGQDYKSKGNLLYACIQALLDPLNIRVIICIADFEQFA